MWTWNQVNLYWKQLVYVNIKLKQMIRYGRSHACYCICIWSWVALLTLLQDKWMIQYEKVTYIYTLEIHTRLLTETALWSRNFVIFVIVEMRLSTITFYSDFYRLWVGEIYIINSWTIANYYTYPSLKYVLSWLC